MVCTDCEGGWEFRTEKSPLSVKLIVKKMSQTDWIVACMVPRGNMMHCLLKEEGGKNLNQVKFNTTGKDPPDDILEVETEMAEFLETGINNITREGNSLRVKAADREIVFEWDRSQ
eukprot:GFUD01072989.1.p1 GENE.GFUD01072989.1~~GFUD01072989.1.p1  ORF type:complete len:133 (-),score=42.91 GFUD01072989.1:14-361(-)